MADRSIKPTFSPPGPSPWRSGATTFHSVPRYRCLWRQSWQSPHSSSCATCAAVGTRHDNVHGNGNRRGWPSQPRSLRQHFARPAQDTILVLLLPDTVRDLLFDPTSLHVHHVAQIERRDIGCDQPVVGLPPHPLELHRSPYPEPISNFLPQLRNRFNLCSIDHYGGKHLRRIRSSKNAILGLGDFGDRRVSYLFNT